MVKFLNEEELKKVVDEAGSGIYIYQKEKAREQKERQWLYEEDGSMLIQFLTGIAKVQPNEDDVLGRTWHPKLTDKDGNPVLSKYDGKPMKAWDKYEAKALVKGKEFVYGFGGGNSVPFKAMCSEMIKNGIKNVDLVGTKWKIKCIDSKKYLWSFDFIEKGEIPTEKKENNGNLKVDVISKVKEALNHVKEANPGKILIGIAKPDLVDAIGFFSHMNEKQINGVWQQLVTEGLIREENGKVFFN